MMRQLFFIFVILVSHAANAFALDVKEITSANGIKAWFVEDHDVPLINVRYWFASGTADDTPETQGATRMLSGLIDEGTKKLEGEPFRAEMRRIGMRVSFDANLDFFENQFSVPSQNREVAYDLIGQTLTDLSFPPQAFARMQKFFMTDEQARANVPEEIGLRALFETALPGHSYTRALALTDAKVAELTREKVENAYRRIFTKANLGVVIVGDLTEAQAKELLDKVFARLPDGKSRAASAGDNLNLARSNKVVDAPLAQTLIMFMSAGIPANDPDYQVAQLASNVMRGTLNGVLRIDQGLTYGASFDMVQTRGAVYTIGKLRTDNTKAAKVLQQIDYTMELMKGPGVTEELLDNLKSVAAGKLTLGIASSSELSEALMKQQQLGFPADYSTKLPQIIEKVDLDDLLRVIDRLIDKNRTVFVLVGKPN